MSRPLTPPRVVLDEVVLERERRLFADDVAGVPVTDEDRFALHIDCPVCGARRGRRCDWAARFVEASAHAHAARVSLRWTARLSATDIELIDGRVESYVDPFLIFPTLRQRAEVFRFDAREWRERFAAFRKKPRRLW